MNNTKLKKSHEYLKILILRTVGNFLILSSVFMVAKTFYQPVQQEIRYFIEKQANKQYIVVSSKEEAVFRLQKNDQPKGGLNSLLNIKPVEALIPEDPNFSVVIPKIGANARIIANVDVSNEKVYLEALKKEWAMHGGLRSRARADMCFYLPTQQTISGM